MPCLTRRGALKHLLSFAIISTVAYAAHASTVIVPTDDKLIIESRAIVRAKVLSTVASLDSETGHTFTYVRLDVQAVFKGEISSSEIVLKQFGGATPEGGTVIFDAPEFTEGERVILFLDTWGDGSLRVHDEFLGKYAIVKDQRSGRLIAVRGAPSDGTRVVGQALGDQATDRMELAAYLRRLRRKIAADAASSQRFADEYYKDVPIRMSATGYPGSPRGGQIHEQFHFFQPPARWFQPDSGQPVTVLINLTSAPAGAQADVDAAMSAWSTVANCSLRVVDGGATTQCIQAGTSVVEFNNCHLFYQSSGLCQDILARGGFDYTTSASTVVGGISFFQITGGFVSFNPYAACWFSQPCNVQEITTHEMGHSLGMHHSWDPSYGGAPTLVEQDATMYYTAHFDGRCASLRSDDIAGISTLYPAATPPPAYSGWEDDAGCDIIEGWAWDGNNPNTTVNVDIFDGGTFVGTAPAGYYREDLLDVLASPNHGFAFPTPAGLRDGAIHSISVKVSGTSIVLGGGPRPFRCSGAASNFQGSLDGVGCDSMTGWAWDATYPASVLNVDIYDGSTYLLTTTATQFRQDLQTALGSAYHGFTVPTPASLRDGNNHTITVKFSATGANLTWNNPQTFACAANTPVLQGSLDPINCNQITGYALDASDLRSIIEVAIYFDGNFWVAIPAEQFSQTIGYHEFIYTVPASWKDGKQHTVSVNFSGRNVPVSNSPRPLTCP